jgi:hypothetical protein
MLGGSELWEEYGVIDPKWKIKTRWNVFMYSLLLFVAFVTPFDVRHPAACPCQAGPDFSSPRNVPCTLRPTQTTK